VATSNFSLSSLPYPLTIQNLKIGIAVTEWNKHIIELLRTGALETLQNVGFSDSQIRTLIVPGAFELPLAAKWLIEDGCDAVICLGAVIRGNTPHFDYVCNATTDGILRIGLDSGQPCIFGVLTTDNEEQAMERCGGKHGHKGKEAAESALWMLAVDQSINKLYLENI
jgi:6,7-dimethyl-8-ribityllumazine synthase